VFSRQRIGAVVLRYLYVPGGSSHNGNSERMDCVKGYPGIAVANEGKPADF
jgi:hypothetical protein